MRRGSLLRGGLISKIPTGWLNNALFQMAKSMVFIILAVLYSATFKSMGADSFGCRF